jgi:biopolymer transport protein ExbB
MITSASGLAIGIMAVLAHHFLTGRVRALVHDFEWVGHEIFEFLTTDRELLAKADADEPGKEA